MTTLNADRFGYYVIPLILFGAAMDFLLKYYVDKKVSFPLSGLITSLACIMLVKTKLVMWPYFLAIFLGQIFKYLFKDKFGHFFNPANIGLFMVILTFSGFANIVIAQWIVEIELFILMALMGLFVSFINKRLYISISYLVTIVICRYLFAYFNSFNIMFFLGSVVNTGALIYTFHMITDPLTSPKSAWGQIIYGITIALVDFQFRKWQLPFAPIFALCLVSAVLNPMRKYLPIFRSC